MIGFVYVVKLYLKREMFMVFYYNNLEIGTVLIDNGNITISENGYSQNRSIY